jgi:threonyl-tRNA synthetase
MLHRAILGSLERFIGVYLEHTAGHLPTWMSPVQVAILNITDRQIEYAQKVNNLLQAAGIRSMSDERGEKLGYKIREAQLQKIPYMLILGDKEKDSGTVSVRLKNGKILEAVPLNEFTEKIVGEIKERKLESVFQPSENLNQEANHSSI